MDRGIYLNPQSFLILVMSRTGPGYVESESELRSDIKLKQKQNEVSDTTAETFLILYEFAKELGDRVSIGEAKNANFQCKVEAHQGDYRGDPSIFTVNVTRELKVWPAGMPVKNDALDSVQWEEQDYSEFKRAFQSLRGVHQNSTTVAFEEFASNNNLSQFKDITEQFVSTCREQSDTF